MVRALVGSGSPNDLNDDLRDWLVSVAQQAGADAPPADLEDFAEVARTLQTAAAQIIATARDRAPRGTGRSRSRRNA